jgi:hypothetical protein
VKFAKVRPELNGAHFFITYPAIISMPLRDTLHLARNALPSPMAL